MILTSALTCLALNIYHEARGEPKLGKELVAITTLNRAEGDNSIICQEVLRKHQFSWTASKVSGRTLNSSGKPKEKEAWEDSKRIAEQALNGRFSVPVRYSGVTHFFSHRKRGWEKQLKYVGQIGNHHFYMAK
ncbi:cell wall hydrolase [Acinetobacter baumannii]